MKWASHNYASATLAERFQDRRLERERVARRKTLAVVALCLLCWVAVGVVMAQLQ